MRLRFLGTGDAFGSGGRMQTCMLIDADEGRYLLDCGATSLTALKAAAVDPNTIDAVLVTHLHGDHFGGLPFLLLDGRFSKRTRPLVIAGPPGIADRVVKTMDLLFPGSFAAPRRFEVEFRELAEREPAAVGALQVQPFEVIHGSGAPPYAYRIVVDGRTIAYSGDTEWTDTLVDVAAGADLFVCEAYSADRAVRNHLDYATLAARRASLRCARLIVTHMGPDMLARVGELPVESAYDGLDVAL